MIYNDFRDSFNQQVRKECKIELHSPIKETMNYAPIKARGRLKKLRNRRERKESICKNYSEVLITLCITL